MRLTRTLLSWALALTLFWCQAAAVAQITALAGDGVLNAPYRGTIDPLREASMDVPYGEIYNIVLPALDYPGGEVQESMTIKIWYDADPDNVSEGWDRSLIRMYHGADASGNEIDLAGSDAINPYTIGGYGFSTRLFSLRALGTKTTLVQKYTLHFEYHYRSNGDISFYCGTPSYGYPVTSSCADECDHGGDSPASCISLPADPSNICYYCFYHVDDYSIPVSVAPTELVLGDDLALSRSYLPSTKVLDVLVGNARLAVPIGRTADMIGVGLVDVDYDGYPQIRRVDFLSPGASESTFIPYRPQFWDTSLTYQKNYPDYGTPWAGFARGWHHYERLSKHRLYSPDGVVYEFQSDDDGSVLLDNIQPLDMEATNPESNPAAVTYGYDGSNRVDEIHDGNGNVISLDWSANDKVAITTSDSRAWDVRYDPTTKVITAVIPDPAGDAKGARYFSWRKNVSNEIIGLDAGGRVTQVRTQETEGSGVLYEFVYYDNGELKEEWHKIDGALRKVVTHEDETATGQASTRRRIRHLDPSLPDPDRVIELTYDTAHSLGHKLQKIKADSQETQYEFAIGTTVDSVPIDQLGQLKSITLPDNSTIEHTYDNGGDEIFGFRTQSVHRKGDDSLALYDVEYEFFYTDDTSQRLYYAPRIIKRRDGRGYETTYTYEPGGADGDGGDRPADGLDGEISNQLWTVTGPLTSNFARNLASDGTRQAVTDYYYYGQGDSRIGLLQRQDVKTDGTDKVRTEYDYDALRRRKSVTIDPEAGGKNIVTEYRTLDGAVTQDELVRDSEGYVTRTQYGKAGRVAKVSRYLSAFTTILDTSPPSFDGQACYETAYAYNTAGWLETTTIDNKDQDGAALTPATITTTYVRDDLGRLTQETTAGQETHYTYTWQGDIKSQYDTSGRGVVNEYDARGLLAKTTPLVSDGAGGSSEDENLAELYTYDEVGRRIYSCYANGAACDTSRPWIEFVYDGFGRLEFEIRHASDSGAITTGYEYDGASNVTRTYVTEDGATYADTVHAYDEAGFQYLTRERKTVGTDDDTDDRVVIRRFDCAGDELENRGLGADESADRVIATTYDTAGRVETIGDSEEGLVTLVRDQRGNVIQRTVKLDAGTNAVSTTEYDALGRVTKTIDPLDQFQKAHFRTRSYDSRGNLVRETAYAGADDTGTSGSPVRATAYAYDLAGRLITQAGLADPGQAMDYTPVNHTDRVTRFEYDDDGRIKYRRSYVTIGGTSDTRSVKTLYDAHGRVWQVADPDAGGDYDAPAAQNYVQTDYDTQGRLDTRKVHDGNQEIVTTFGYDGYSRVASEQRAGLTTYFDYDALDRRVFVKDPKGIDHLTIYNDLVGHQITTQRKKGANLLAQTVNTYDRHGNLIQQEVNNYANDGTPLGVQTTAHAYDTLDRRLRTVHPDSSDDVGDPACTDCERWTYDDAGRLISTLAPEHGGDSARRSTTIAHEARGYVTARTTDFDEQTPDEVVELFTTNAVGQLEAAQRTEALSSSTVVTDTTRYYTHLGDLDYEQQTITVGGSTAGTRTVDYAHNEAGYLTQITYPSVVTLDIVPTLTGRIDTISEGGTTVVDYGYYPGGNLLQSRTTTTNNIGTTIQYNTAWDYDAKGRVGMIDNDLVTGGSSSPIVAHSFVYDNNNNPTLRTTEQSSLSQFHPEESREYTVDDLDRLVQTAYVVGGSTMAAEQAILDAVGNREQSTDRDGNTLYYDLANEANEYGRIGATSSGDANIDHDAGGNLSVDEDGRHYVYDEKNRLIQVWAGEPGTSQQLAAFFHDALGRRIRTIIGDVTTHFYYDGKRIIEEYDVTGATETRRAYHINGGQYIDERVATYDDVAGEFAYHIPTLNFTVVASGNASGSQIYAYDHSSYGDSAGSGSSRDFDADMDVDQADFAMLEACWSGPDVPLTTGCEAQDLDGDNDVDGTDYVLFQPCMSGDGNPIPAGCESAPPNGTFTLQGRPLDVLPDGHVLVHVRARHYDPKHGRFLQRDPLGPVDGPNLYEAFGNNPLANVDPMGTEVIDGVEDMDCDELAEHNWNDLVDTLIEWVSKDKTPTTSPLQLATRADVQEHLIVKVLAKKGSIDEFELGYKLALAEGVPKEKIRFVRDMGRLGCAGREYIHELERIKVQMDTARFQGSMETLLKIQAEVACALVTGPALRTARTLVWGAESAQAVTGSGYVVLTEAAPGQTARQGSGLLFGLREGESTEAFLRRAIVAKRPGESSEAFLRRCVSSPRTLEGVDLRLRYKPGWTEAQKAAARQKASALTSADTVVVKNPARSGTSAATRYRRAGNVIPPGRDVDHIVDLQLNGVDDILNMNPLDRSVNRSLGAQIQHRIKDLEAGTPINTVTVGD